MPKKSIFCTAQSDTQAIGIVQQLKASGFRPQDISVLFPDKQGTRDFAHTQKTKAPEGAVTGASTGGVLGGALGWLAGIGALAIPGLGPFVAAGPLMAALSGVAVGAAVGGITGALVGMGMPEFEAKRYEGKIKSGNILISVHSDNNEAADKARAIFERSGAEDISSAGEAAVPARTSAGGGRQVATEGGEAKARGRKANGQTATQTSAPAAPSDAAAGSRKSRTSVTPPSQGVAGGEPTRIEIEARAYQIYIAKGRPEGRDMENWLEAEKQLKTERRKSANAASR